MPPRKSSNSNASLEETVYVKKAKRGSAKAKEVAKKTAEIEVEVEVESNDEKERNFDDIVINMDGDIDDDDDNAEEADTGIGLRDHSAQLDIDDKGDFSYKVDVSGFRPGEISVELQGNKIVVHGEYMDKNKEDEFVHRKFMRCVLIPAGINTGTVKCEMDNDGRLCISAQSESGKARKIPIVFKQTGQQQQKPQVKVEVEIIH